MPLLDVVPRFQTDDFSCGAVGIAMSLEFHGLNVGKWIKQLTQPVVGMSAEVVTAAMHAAYAGKIVSGRFDVPLLRHLTRQGVPCLCLITNPVVGGGHWLLVRGVTGGSRGRVHVCCPTNGRESHRIKDFVTMWTLRDVVGGWCLDQFAVAGLPD